MKLTTTQRLALLQTVTVYVTAFLQFGFSTPFIVLVLSTIGYLWLIFYVSQKETLMNSIKTISSSSTTPTTTADAGEFYLLITDVRQNPDSNRVEYRLEGAYNDHRWTSWLRYSTLRQLKGRAGPKADEKFPEKSSVGQWVRGADSDIYFVDERRKSLNRFLREAIPNKEAFETLVQNPQVRQALGVPSTLEITGSGGKLKEEVIVKEGITVLDMLVDITKYSDNGGDGWTFYKKADGITTFLKREGDLTYVMGKGLVDELDRPTLVRFIANPEYRKKWDDLFKKGTMLQVVQEPNINYHYPTSEDPLHTGRSADWEIFCLLVVRVELGSPAKAFVAERDAVNVSIMARRRSDGALFLGTRSIVDPRVPEGIDGYVRSKIICVGIILEERKDGKPGCLATTVGMVDPNGQIPQFVVNLVAPQKAFVMRDISRECLKLSKQQKI